MAKIGFLGIGNMGRGMALRLLDAGHSVTAYNRTPEKAAVLKNFGAMTAGTPREAAEGADAIVAMVGDDEASREVWTGEHGALSARHASSALAIECSTISHRWTLELAALAHERGLRFADCPVTGLPDAAAAGTLGIFVGAPADTLEAARPFLEPMAGDIVHFGPIGSGIAYKLMINLMGAVQIAAGAEGLVIAERAGLDLQAVADAIQRGQAASPQVVRNTQRMVGGDHETNVVFSGRWRLKDTLYGIEFARSLGVDAAFGETAGRVYQMLVASGFGDLNETKVIDVIRFNRPRRS
jgi:3-hydroxyisobutyrate dehydrogenase